MQEFSDLLNEQNCVSSLIIPHLDLVIEMIEKNIFRPLPVLKKTAGNNDSGMDAEDDVLIDPAWPHLQVNNLSNLILILIISLFMNFSFN